MNSLWKTILDGLTFRDLAGQRQPRTFTVMTGLILLLLLAAGGMAGFHRYLLMSRVQAVPEPVLLPSQTAEPVDAESTPSASPEAIGSVGCPTDSEAWSFTPTVISDNYQVIQPACVYLGLEKTIAWALAVREGYSRAEATEALGFTQMPLRQLDTVTIPKNANELVDVPVSFIPPHAAFKEWRLDANGRPAVTYALRGCFETSTVKGNHVEIWGGEYPVICLVVEDAENTRILYALNGHMHTSVAIPMRSFLLFGYLGNGQWAWLGAQTEPKLEISNAVENASDRLTVATLYDSRPWDSTWLRDTYRLDMQPLPESWQSFTDENEKEYILATLSGVAP